MPPRLLAIVAARPNFVKLAPVLRALDDDSPVAVEVLHTGQHYDHALSGSFFEMLGMRPPDHHLEGGPGSHAEQTAAAMVGVERTLLASSFDALLCAGDVNSTLAAALAAVKLGVPVIHLESGLRSGDWTMPEEINRVVTDRVSSLLLCHSPEALTNLAAEGIRPDRVQMVGNTMIDSLLRMRRAAQQRGTLARLGVEPRSYILATLHRPALVDDDGRLAEIVAALARLARDLPVLLPAHPRTSARLAAVGPDGLEDLVVLEPLDYLDFLALEDHARLVITDSGGVQEETSVLGVPCFTYRDSTERPVTVRLGTNTLVGTSPAALEAACRRELDGGENPAQRDQIPLWDGAAGPRAAEAITEFLARRTEDAAGPSRRRAGYVVR
jgi:UDP-N-acetylglucosamine 2-epimerase (non-hydrolysing)